MTRIELAPCVIPCGKRRDRWVLASDGKAIVDAAAIGAVMPEVALSEELT